MTHHRPVARCLPALCLGCGALHGTLLIDDTPARPSDVASAAFFAGGGRNFRVPSGIPHQGIPFGAAFSPNPTPPPFRLPAHRIAVPYGSSLMQGPPLDGVSPAVSLRFRVWSSATDDQFQPGVRFARSERVTRDAVQLRDGHTATSTPCLWAKKRSAGGGWGRDRESAPSAVSVPPTLERTRICSRTVTKPGRMGHIECWNHFIDVELSTSPGWRREETVLHVPYSLSIGPGKRR